MKVIEEALEPITGYLVSIKRNAQSGWYELEIGIYSSWVFDENNEIKCEILTETDKGKLIKISPKNNNIGIDDLVSFVEIIIATNMKIAEKEKQFTDKMAEMKGMLEKEAQKFYGELEELKVNSFKNINDSFVSNLHTENVKKETRGRKPKATSGLTETEIINQEIAK